MPSKPTRPRRRKAAAVKLPTIAGLIKMTVPQRTALFRRWLKAQPRQKTYDWSDTTKCALGQFATAIHRERAEGAVNDIRSVPMSAYGEDSKNRSVELFPYTCDDRSLPDALCHNTTFGAASDAFEAALVAQPTA